jgi:hypothetical protein
MRRRNQRYDRHFPNVESVARALSESYCDPSHGNKSNPLRELLFIICSLQTNEAFYQSTALSEKSSHQAA